MADAIRVPEPLSSDTDDVTDALDVAQSLWENGKRADALHWVKRAAESAKSDPTRMASLSRAAEDLERAMTPRAATPPPVPAAKPAVSRPPPVPTKASKPPPVPTATARATAPPPPNQSMPQAAMRSVPPPPPVPTLHEADAPAPTPRSVPSVKPASASTQSKISVPPPAVVARPSKVPQLLQQPPASEDRVRLAPALSDKTLRVHATMRVSVKTSVRDGSLLVVRPLADGAAVPAGAREALLTFVNDDVDDAEAAT
jgi:hypothetical protein